MSRRDHAPSSDTPSNNAPFSEATVSAVVAHMNADHLEDSLLMVRTLGARPEAVAATVATVDPAGVHFAVNLPDGTTSVVVPWGAPVVDRAGIRHELVDMVERGRALLG